VQQGYGPSSTEKCLTNSLQMLVALLVLLAAYWAAVTYLEVDDILNLGFGDNGAAWNAYLSTMGDASNTTPSGGRKLALIINVTYKDAQYAMNQEDPKAQNVQLDGTYTDAVAIRDYLTTMGFATAWLRDKGVCTHGPVTCSACMEKKENGFKTYPSATNIKKAMKAFASSSRAGDVLWLFFAGHGAQLKDRGGDEADGQDECILPADYNSGGGTIRDDWLKSEFRTKIDPKAETVAVFDCCHSGTMFDLPYSCDVENGQWASTGQPDYKDDGFFFYMSGCQDKQTSAEVITSKGSNGAMTTALCKLIQKNAAEKKNINDFLASLRDRLKNKKSCDGNAQKPNMCCTVPFDLEKTSFKQMFDGKIPEAA